MGDQSFKELVEELDDLNEKPVVYEFSKDGTFKEDKSHGAYDGNNS